MLNSRKKDRKMESSAKAALVIVYVFMVSVKCTHFYYSCQFVVNAKFYFSKYIHLVQVL